MQLATHTSPRLAVTVAQHDHTMAMPLEIDYNRLLTVFDKLASQGFIHYGPSKTVQLADDGFTVRHQLLSPQLAHIYRRSNSGSANP